MQGLIVHRVAREAVDMRSMGQQQSSCLGTAKSGSQMERSPTVRRTVMNQHRFVLQQRLDSAAIPQRTSLEDIQTLQVRKQEVSDHRLAVVNAPQKSRDALGVSAGNQGGIFFRSSGNFRRLPGADQLKETLAHRARLASESATAAARTASFAPFCTEPGLVRFE